MEEMKVQAFAEVANSSADIIGILGELQSIAILRLITGDERKVTFLGHEVNKDGQKIGIDVALEEIGFQIKNYAIHGSDGSKNIQLSGDYTLKNFLEQVRNSLNGIDTDSLKQFYAVSAYHISVAREFNPLRKAMDTIQKDRLPSLYHGAIADLLPIKEISWVDKNTKEMIGSGYNVFYLIGGKYIVPISKIINTYILYL
jgi:hypothetical protein